MSSTQKRKLDDISNAENNDFVPEPVLKKRKLIENTIIIPQDQTNETNKNSMGTQSNNLQNINTILPTPTNKKMDESNQNKIEKSIIETINSNKSNQNKNNTINESNDKNGMNVIDDNSMESQSNNTQTNKINESNQNENEKPKTDTSIQTQNTNINTKVNTLEQDKNDNSMDTQLNTAQITEDPNNKNVIPWPPEPKQNDKEEMNELKIDNSIQIQSTDTNTIANKLDTELNTTQITEENKNEISTEIKPNDKEEMDENIQTTTDTTTIDPYKQYNWEEAKIILRATSIFADNNNHYKYLDGGNFIKSIDWSPNGLYLLSNSNDRKLRIFNPFNHMYENENNNEKKDNEMKPLVIYKHTEPIYDISFYPLFKTNDYSTNLFLSCSRHSPISMFNTYSNNKICSYKYLFGDIVETAYSVEFNNNGQYIFGGYKKYIIQFSTDNCGNEYYKKIKCVNNNNFGQKSIISCIKFMNNNNNIFGCGSYDGIAQIFDIRCTYALCGFKCIDNKNNGINNILFSPCNNYILTGQRNTNDIYCWDLRYIKNNYYINNTFYNSAINFDKFNDGNTKVFKDNDNKNNLCAKYKRNIINNQKMQFDIDKYSGYWIVSGNQNNNYCNVYDVNTNDVNVEPKYVLKHDQNVKSVCAAQICPTYPFLATAIGQRTLSKRRKMPKSNNNNNNNNKNNEIDSSESESDSDSDLECSNVNDICIWDLRFKS